MKDYEQTELERLEEPVKRNELKRVILSNQPVYVFARQWHNDEENVLSFVHGNKKGKKIYKASRERFEEIKLKRKSENRKNQDLKIKDTIDKKTFQKLKKIGKENV